MKQKWRVAISLVLVYYPISVYLDYGNWEGTWLGRLAPSAFLGGVVYLLVFWAWIYVVEYLQDRLFRWLGEEFSLTMRWPALLATIVSCLGLSVVFVFVLGGAFYVFDNELRKYGWQIATGGVGPANEALWVRYFNGYALLMILSVFYLLANNRAQQRLSALTYRSQQLETKSILCLSRGLNLGLAATGRNKMDKRCRANELVLHEHPLPVLRPLWTVPLGLQSLY